MKKILIAAILTALLALIPTMVFASNTNRTLQPGNVYEFTGLDARVISHINVTGTGRYEIVAWNAQGEITRFGTSLGRFSVSGTGGVQVTPLAPLAVSFDSSRVQLSVQAGSALTSVDVPQGQTVRLANNHATSVNIRATTASLFDFAIFNRSGTNTDFGRLVRLPQIGLPAGGHALVTAANNSTSVYFPTRLADDINAEIILSPALYVINLLSGETYTIANSTGVARTLRFLPEFTNVNFFHEHITRGRDGHVISHGEREANYLPLGANQTVAITALMDAEMFFPYAWRAAFGLGADTTAPAYNALEAGDTITVTNDDLTRAHSVFLHSLEDFTVDYTITHEDALTFNTRESLGGESFAITLQPGATATITVLEAYANLHVSLPAVNEVSATLGDIAALARHILEPGQSLYISYEGNYTARFLPIAHMAVNLSLDFVRYENGYISDFGTRAVRSQFVLTDDESVLITNSTEEVILLHIPQAYLENGLEIEETNRIALHRHVADATVQINNRDRLYNHSILVLNETARNVEHDAHVLDFLALTSNINIVDFGTRPLGLANIPVGQRLTIASNTTGVIPTIIFPAELLGSSLTISNAADDQLLHRFTLTPGRSISVRNPFRDLFIIRTNSGTIEILPNSIITITAPIGENMELYLPMHWAIRLGLVS